MDSLPADLNALVSPPAISVSVDDIPELRGRFLSDAACSLGARGGLAKRASQIRLEIEGSKSLLDQSFNFQTVLLGGGMLPPVVTEARDAVRQDGPGVIRFAGAIYRIVAAERLVTVAPSWRDYLYVGLVSADRVDAPHDAFLPKTAAEKQIWSRTVVDCWEKGVSQANMVFKMNLDRLNRDYEGMIRYRLLVAKGMFVPPSVGVEQQRVGGDASHLVVDDQTYRISSGGRFQFDGGKWK